MTDEDRPIDIRTGKPVQTFEEKLAIMQKKYEELHPKFGDKILNYPAFAAYRDHIVRVAPETSGGNVTSLAQFKAKKKKKE